MDIRRILRWTIKKAYPILAVCLTILLVWQLFDQSVAAGKQVKNLNATEFWIYLPVVLLGTIFNWWLESEKWRILIAPEFQSGRQQALAAILGAMAIGLMTPARVGEIPGRSMWYPVTMQSTLVSKSLFSSMIQNVWHLAGGMVAIIYLISGSNRSYLPLPLYGQVFIQVVLGVSLLVFLPRWLRSLSASGNRWVKSISGSVLRAFHTVSGQMVNQVFLLAGIRYMVYLFQYVLILSVLAGGADIQDIIAACAMQFMLQSLLPVPAILSLPVRGQVAIFSCSVLQMPAALAVAGSATLWILNLGLPGLVGAVVLFKRKGIPIPVEMRQ